ncbi:hypothetical protein D6777_02305 [Candidatus Woesearchaeota archaeon]|nr:MAG: hypothetical protein D6777_02305 [Candidatus Woesearchaeota archaeon]
MEFNKIFAIIVLIVVFAICVSANNETFVKSYMQEFNELGLPTEFFNTTFNLIKEEQAKKEPNKTKIDYMFRKMKERRDEGLYLVDYKRAIELKINDYKKEGINVTEERRLWQNVSDYLVDDEFEAAKDLLDYIDSSLENKLSEKASLKSFIIAGQSYIIKWRKQILLVLFVVVLIAAVLFKPVQKHYIKEKIRRMEIEERMIQNLMKDTQVRYFKKKEISGTIYNIKMDAYRKRLAEIKSKLPVYKSKLSKEEIPEKEKLGIIKVK